MRLFALITNLFRPGRSISDTESGFCECKDWEPCGCGNQPPYHCMWCCLDLSPETLREWDFERWDFGPASDRHFIGPRHYVHISRGDNPNNCEYCGAPYPPISGQRETFICYAPNWGDELPHPNPKTYWQAA